ncbi:hypothetical protein FISHEDRAFT_61767 [Fistulina hepatica ATCC 64428]|uniref:C2H2-type domain-containing protein n=1 Tax=Fistulina hepatica ATCC 64428 TaxID=1128425 RepID=A0A0D7A4A9_9AGAR|nr:hypothetical protein FISHEDRAFT_61767 [Fistulina hepatica ATCC 64428]
MSMAGHGLSLKRDSATAQGAWHRSNDNLPPIRSVLVNQFKNTPYLASDSGSDADTDVPSTEWLKHVREAGASGGAVQYRCVWPDGRGGTCGYTAKRSPVKRHVEDKHMGKRQKSNLNNHINARHTGQNPYKCEYGCGASYPDSARRLRHQVKVHNYVPKETKPRAAAGKSSDYETVKPWTA